MKNRRYLQVARCFVLLVMFCISHAATGAKTNAEVVTAGKASSSQEKMDQTRVAGETSSADLVSQSVAVKSSSEELLEKSADPANERITLTMEGVELRQAIAAFGRLSGANIIIPDLDVGKGSEEDAATVTASFKDVPWRPALEAILDAYSFELYEKVPGSTVYTVRKKPAGAPAPQPVRIFSLNHANSHKVETLISEVITDGVVKGYDAGNSVVVKATSSQIAKVAEIIDALDKPRKQIYVEANIFELSDLSSDEVGIDWAGATDNGGLSQHVLDIQDLNWLADWSGRWATDWSALDQAQAAVISPADFSIYLNALKQRNGAQQVSNPKLIVGNGEMAKIEVITKEPHIEAENNYDEDGNLISTTYSQIINEATPSGFFEYGLTLEVTPTVNTKSNIMVNIEPTISRFLKEKTTADGNTFPYIREKKVKTSFILENGKVAVIGGLIEDKTTKKVHSVPILKEIPFIGKTLFSNTSTESEQIENVIFVRVGVVDPSDEVSMTSLQEGAPMTNKKRIIEKNDSKIEAHRNKLLQESDSKRVEEAIKNLNKEHAAKQVKTLESADSRELSLETNSALVREPREVAIASEVSVAEVQGGSSESSEEILEAEQTIPVAEVVKADSQTPPGEATNEIPALEKGAVESMEPVSVPDKAEAEGQAEESGAAPGTSAVQETNSPPQGVESDEVKADRAIRRLEELNNQKLKSQL